jgi:single-strand DNA-binding protein
MINAIILVGRITKSPELKYTQSNIAVVSFTLAVNRQFTDESGERQADFIQCVVWRKQAENMAKYVDKGHLIGIQGRIQTRTYDDDNGKTIYITEVVADNIQFLETKKDDYPQSDEEIKETFKHGNPTNKPKEIKEIDSADEEDLPF